MSQKIEKLKQIAGEGNFLDSDKDISPFLEDWRGHIQGTTPLVLFPVNTKKVQEIIRYCYDNDIKIVSQGGNTSLCGANVPNSKDDQLEIVLNSSKLNRILEIDPFNQSMLVESGCILQNIQDKAEENGFLFPLSLSAEGSCQIGGNISTNAGGVNVLKYGMARDQVMGIEVVLPDGSIFTDLKSLRKDNTGYDLKQLFIGAEGTLGVITKISLKLSSKPMNTITSLVSQSSIQNAIELFRLAKKEFGDNITAFEVMSKSCLKAVEMNLSHINLPLGSNSNWQVIFEIINNDEDKILTFLEHAASNSVVLDGTIAKNEKEKNEIWLIRHSISEAEKLSGKGIHHDISLPIKKIPDFLQTIGPALDDVVGDSVIYTFGHLGDGNLHFTKKQPDNMTENDFMNLSENISGIVYEITESLGGSFSAEHGVGSKLVDSLMRYSDATKIDLMTKIKSSLDPKNIMNPDKLINL